MTADHRNLSREDFDFEDYDAYLDDRLKTFLDENETPLTAFTDGGERRVDADNDGEGGDSS